MEHFVTPINSCSAAWTAVISPLHRNMSAHTPKIDTVVMTTKRFFIFSPPLVVLHHLVVRDGEGRKYQNDIPGRKIFVYSPIYALTCRKPITTTKPGSLPLLISAVLKDAFGECDL